MTYEQKIARARLIAADAMPRVRERKDRLADNEIVRVALQAEQDAIAARAVTGYYRNYILPKRTALRPLRKVLGGAAA